MRYPILKRAVAVANELHRIGDAGAAEDVERRVRAVEDLLNGRQNAALARDIARLVGELRELESVLVRAGMGLPKQRRR